MAPKVFNAKVPGLMILAFSIYAIRLYALRAKKIARIVIQMHYTSATHMSLLTGCAFNSARIELTTSVTG